MFINSLIHPLWAMDLSEPKLQQYRRLYRLFVVLLTITTLAIALQIQESSRWWFIVTPLVLLVLLSICLGVILDLEDLDREDDRREAFVPWDDES